MTYNVSDLLKLDRGWNSVDSLKENQIKELKLQLILPRNKCLR
jgi:hypothetical protein